MWKPSIDDPEIPSFRVITLRTIVSHTVTYFVVGALAFTIFDYDIRFTEPPLSFFMRPTDDPLVIAGVLFQPLRGLLFGIVFYLLRDSLFRKRPGWFVTWIMLVFIGIFSTFGPSPGSIEGMIYTTLPLRIQLGGLIEVLVQSLLFSVLIVYWVKHPKHKWLNWTFSILFVLVIVLPLLGLLVQQTEGTPGFSS